MKTISISLQEIPSGDPPVVTDVFIDTVGDPEFYKSRLTSALGKDFGRFVIEKKADATYKIVSAASIIAKVTSESIYKLCVYYHCLRNLSSSNLINTYIYTITRRRQPSATLRSA